MAVDRALIGSLLQLRNFPEFAPFRRWLNGQRDFWRDALETQRDSDTLRQAQGRAQVYKEILDMLDQAEAMAEKERGKPQRAVGMLPKVPTPRQPQHQ